MTEQNRCDTLIFNPGSLVGSSFHSYLRWGDRRDEPENLQGVIVAQPAPQLYLVQLWDHLQGQDSYQVLVRLESMLGWVFYDSFSTMVQEHEKKFRVSKTQEEGKP
jgi:hypothetical protein